MERKARRISSCREVQVEFQQICERTQAYGNKDLQTEEEILGAPKAKRWVSNAGKITCRTHFFNESLHTDSASLVSRLSITSEQGDDNGAIGK